MNPPRSRGRTGALALAAVLIGLPALAAGCGTPRASGAATSSCPTLEPGVTPTSIRIGLVAPDSGPPGIVGLFAGARSAVNARVELENARGGVEGRRIELVWRDDEATGAGFSLAVRHLVDTEGVFGLVALTVNLAGGADWLSAQDVPVTGFASSADWSDHPNVFHFGNLFNKGTVSTFGDYLSAQGGTRAVIVVDPSQESSPDLTAAQAASLAGRGVHIADQITFT